MEQSSSGRRITNKNIYEQTLSDGKIFGEIGPRDINRYRDTAQFIHSDAQSLLDVGCCTGEWLHHVCRIRELKEHLGVDVADNRIQEARRRYPALNLKTGYVEQLNLQDQSFDTVTCCEVLEHIDDWLSVFHSLFRYARLQVLITVPYRENIVETVCIHCGEATPLYGHLRSYTEETFPQVDGWNLRFGKIKDRNPRASNARRFYRFFRPHYPWLVASYVCHR